MKHSLWVTSGKSLQEKVEEIKNYKYQNPVGSSVTALSFSILSLITIYYYFYCTVQWLHKPTSFQIEPFHLGESLKHISRRMSFYNTEEPVEQLFLTLLNCVTSKPKITKYHKSKENKGPKSLYTCKTGSFLTRLLCFLQ